LAARKVKKKDYEKLTDANITRVIELLENEKPITKKEACEILNISYNTTRLNKIIEEFKERQERTAERKKANRGKPATKAEICRVIEDYLDGDPVNEIAKRLFRSPAFVKGIIARVGIPSRPTGEEKSFETVLPDQCVAEEFDEEEIVWSAVYHRPAKIVKELTNIDYSEKYGTKAYQIYIIERVEQSSPYFPSVEVGGFFAASAAYDIGSLKHLFEYGIRLNVA
jgi:transposase